MFQPILDNISKRVSLSEEEQRLFCSKLKPQRLIKKQFLVNAGEFVNEEIFVVSGCLKTFYLDDSGVEHILQFAPEDWWAGDLGAFITGKPSTFHVQAIEDSEILLLGREDSEWLYREIPSLERFFRLLIQNAFVSAQQRIIANISQSAEERYEEFIQRYPALEQRVPQYMVASYLGISAEFLSKIRKRRIQNS